MTSKQAYYAFSPFSKGPASPLALAFFILAMVIRCKSFIAPPMVPSGSALSTALLGELRVELEIRDAIDIRIDCSDRGASYACTRGAPVCPQPMQNSHPTQS